MISIVANIVYVLVAISMVVLILLQRGAGAAAGSGFGGGASATVFGARGSANFLSRSTAVLAGLFFLLSLGIGIFVARSGGNVAPVDDLGIMSGVTTPAKPAVSPPLGNVPPAAPAAGDDKPTATPVPPDATPTAADDKPVATDVPAAKAADSNKTSDGDRKPAKGGKGKE